MLSDIKHTRIISFLVSRTLHTVIALLLVLPVTVRAQFASRENLNIYNGLPSNHVYSMLVDRHGYLWIGTDKGVVQYNGHKIKVYNYSDGLAKDDIWKLYEDRKGRIWFLTISDKLGYVLHNKYHKIFNGAHYTLYPRYISEYHDAICFFCPYINEKFFSLCIIKNDTLYTVPTPGCTQYPVIVDNNVLVVRRDSISRMSFDIDSLPAVHFTNQHSIKMKNIGDSLEGYAFMLGDNFFCYTPGSNYFMVCNIRTLKMRKVYTRDITGNEERMMLAYVNKIGYFFSGTQNICVVDSNLKIIAKYPNDSVSEKKSRGNPPITYCILDSLWGVCAGTTQGGIFINSNKPTGHFQKAQVDLKDFIKVGIVSDSVSYWWNDGKSILARVTNGAVSFSRPGLKGIQSVVAYNEDSDIVTCNNSKMFWLNERTDAITSFYRTGLTVGSIIPIVADRENIYLVSNLRGFIHATVTKQTLSREILDNERYNDLLYDSLRQLFCAYNNGKLLLFRQPGRLAHFFTDNLYFLGLNDIQQILFDNRYGNIVVKTYDRLLAFNPEHYSYTSLLPDYRLADARIALKNEMLTVVGRFGIAFSKIVGPGRFSAPIVYHNFKNQSYNAASDVLTYDTKALVNTDKGTYVIPIPTEREFRNSNTEGTPYNLVISYRNTLYDVKSGDTLPIYQSDGKLQFDVINPAANGSVKYQVLLNGVDERAAELNNNEYVMPHLPLEKFYDLSIVAFDDVWRSKPLHLRLYMVPNWWQKSSWRIIFGIAGLTAGIIMLLMAVYITKRVVSANAVKKNKLLELELKSIYAQINPHFIFNTLNVLQSYIHKARTEDAYLHVTKFSKLLRAYVESARNKYITIDDEIQNLKNFIDLQQVRFQNKFRYEITVDDGLAATTRIPAMLLQPVVENAINHGLFHKETDGLLKVSFKREQPGKRIVCIVEDNGVGRRISKTINERSAIKHNSHGNELIKELIYVLNKYERMNIEMICRDNEAAVTGTIVELIINNPPHGN